MTDNLDDAITKLKAERRRIDDLPEAKKRLVDLKKELADELDKLTSMGDSEKVLRSVIIRLAKDELIAVYISDGEFTKFIQDSIFELEKNRKRIEIEEADWENEPDIHDNDDDDPFGDCGDEDQDEVPYRGEEDDEHED